MTLDLTKYDQIAQEDGSILLKPKVVDWAEWVPKVGDCYWFIGANGVAYGVTYDGCDLDNDRLAFGNLFPTCEMARAALPDIRRAMQIIRACRMVEPEFVPDWKKGQQRKYTVFFNHTTRRLEQDYACSCQQAPAYVSSEESARKVIKILEVMK